jgi:GNAT superfamily N-acetyltransferase
MMIRTANAHDVDAIGELWLQLVAYHRQIDPENMPESAPDGARRYAVRVGDSLDDSHTRVFVAEDNGRVVGYVMGVIVDMLPETFSAARSGFLADIYVLPDYRGQGVGRSLVEALRAWLQGRGVTHYEWFVAEKNSDARAFWQKVGGIDVMIRMRASTQPLPTKKDLS